MSASAHRIRREKAAKALADSLADKGKAKEVKTPEKPKTKKEVATNGNSKAESGILSTPTAEAKKA